MASLFARLYHSFITTLFYLSTVIKALFSLRSPPPFPFRQTSIIISYPTPIDLEHGVCSPEADNGSCTSPRQAPSRLPPPSRKPVEKFTSADILHDTVMIYMPAFSVDESGQGRTKSDLRGYDGGRYVQQSAPRPNITHPSCSAKPIASNPGGPPSGPRYMSVISNKSPFQGPHVARHNSKRLPPDGDPFKDLPPNPPLPSAYATEHPPAHNEHALTRGPFGTSTPSRGRKSGRGHRRGPFAAITNIPHLNVPETPIDHPVLMPGPTYPSVYAEKSDHSSVQTIDPIQFEESPHPSLEDTPSPAVLDRPALPLVLSPSPLPAGSRRPFILEPSTPSPVGPSEPAAVDSPCSTVLATPVSQRRRSLSLRRRPAYEDLHSPSPPRPSPKKRSISRLWFYPTETKQAQASTVGPLRINKRSGSSTPTTPGSTSKSDEDDTQDVVLKVRAVFELLRGKEEEDEGATVRELLNRESVESSTHSGQRPEEVRGEEEESDEDEEYGNEVTARSICSPPPPYALSPGLFPSDLYDSLKRNSPLDAFKYIKEDDSPVTPLQNPTLTGASDLRRQNSSSFTYDNNSPSLRTLQASPGSKSTATLIPAVSTELAYFNNNNNNNNNNNSGSPKKLQVPPRSKSTETLTPAISTDLTYFKDQSGLLAPTLSSLTLATAVSTELSYLKDDEQSTLAPPVVIVESVDSAIDDILTSFEHLMTSMGIKVQQPPAAVESTPPRLDVPSVSSTSLRSIKRVHVKPRPETGFYVYGGLAEECDAQWCDLLELDSYDSD